MLKNTSLWYFFSGLLLLSLSWFFIGYWILKTGLDFYPGPNFFYYNQTKKGFTFSKMKSKFKFAFFSTFNILL